MNSRNIKHKIGGSLFAFAFLFGIVFASGSTAQAQQYPSDRDVYYGRDRDDRYRDRDERYRREQRRRERERERRRNEEYNRNGSYGGYGNNDGYGNNGRYGNDIYRVAQDQGYQAGLNTGASDAQRGQSYNPQRSRYYKDATGGYNSSYGNKGQYKQVYRDAFLEGYEQGFRQYNGDYRRGDTRRNSGISIADILGGILGRP